MSLRRLVRAARVCRARCGTDLACLRVCALRGGTARQGTQCVIPYRGDDMEWRALKVMGDVGVVAARTFNPRDEASIAEAIGESDVVINLIGNV